MSQPQSSYHFLEVELIALDESLTRTLNRTMRLCEQAEEAENTEEAARIKRLNKILVATKSMLETLS
jgi:hypothetical protein